MLLISCFNQLPWRRPKTSCVFVFFFFFFLFFFFFVFFFFFLFWLSLRLFGDSSNTPRVNSAVSFDDWPPLHTQPSASNFSYHFATPPPGFLSRLPAHSTWALLFFSFRRMAAPRLARGFFSLEDASTQDLPFSKECNTPPMSRTDPPPPP